MKSWTRIYLWAGLWTLLAAAALQPLAAAEVETVKVPMQDGTELLADIHRPAEGEAPWPVILLRSTYTRNVGVDQFVERGYAAVVQDVRGMGESPGDKHVFHADGWREGLQDGADTVAWILEQPWCNGKVGTHGGSALGITQMLMAPVAKGVAAQDIWAAPSDFYAQGAYHGGVLRKNLIEGWLTAIQQPHLIALWKGSPYFDAYWEKMDVEAKAGDITAPALFVGGWYDIFQQGTLNAFTTRERHGGPGAKGNNYLIMSWSSHGPDIEDDYDLNDNRHDFRISHLRHAFFAANLKGETEKLEEFAKVNYYTFGADTEGAPGNEWREADTWPPFDAAETAYYLHPDGRLSTESPQAEEGSLTFVFDPADPYPTHGGANLLLPSGAFDQRKHSNSRDDLLKFATAPLDAPMEITGRIKAMLYVSSDAPDTDFTAKLVDIYPDGDAREILLVDNIQRVKMRKDRSQPAPLLEGPGHIVELEIDLWSFSMVFAKGHRIGLHISSSNYPRFEVNPNTGDDFPPEDGGETRTARNTVHMASGHPSRLVLPVRPVE